MLEIHSSNTTSNANISSSHKGGWLASLQQYVQRFRIYGRILTISHIKVKVNFRRDSFTYIARIVGYNPMRELMKTVAF